MTYRALAGLALLAAAVFALTACGDKATPAASSSTATDYQSCLRAHGVDVPQGVRGSAFPSGRPSSRPSVRPSVRPSDRPSGGVGGRQFDNNPPEGVDQQTWEKALQACAALRPSFGPGGGGPGGGPGGAASAAYRNCLMENGVNVSGPIDQLDEADPTVAKALSVCAPLRPSARPQPSQ